MKPGPVETSIWFCKVCSAVRIPGRVKVEWTQIEYDGNLERDTRLTVHNRFNNEARDRYAICSQACLQTAVSDFVDSNGERQDNEKPSTIVSFAHRSK